MANEEVTTSLNVDITQFKTAMSAASRYIRQANSEFDKATAGVDNWADSADGLRAKINQLNKTLDAQETQVAALKAEYERVSKEQGESSAGAQNLAIRLNKAEAAVKRTKAEIGKYSKALDGAESDTQDTEQETVQMSAAFDKAAKAAGDLTKKLAGMAGKAVVNGIKGLAAASAGLVTAFLATGEAQKEHITEMAKLDAAYKSAGHSADTAANTYNELYSVIGETDQAVEAAQQIALLADSEKDAAAWAEQAAAVTGRFGDSLMPEVFYESANETLKLNEATGAYVQMLEGTGQSVDAFNKGLQACNTEEEKQAYMLAATQKALGSAGEEYKKANAVVIENNKANAALQEQLAGVGQAALPITTAFKNIGASILGDLMPNIKDLGTSFTEAMNGSKKAASKMGTAVAKILKTLGKKIVKALPTILTVGGSIVTSLVKGIAKAAPDMAEGAMDAINSFAKGFKKKLPDIVKSGQDLLDNLGKGVRKYLPQLLKVGGDIVYKLLDGIVSKLPAMAEGAMDAIDSFVKGFQKQLPIILKKGSELLGKLGDGIRKGLPDLLDKGLDVIMRFAETLYDAAPKLIETGFDLLSDLVQGIMDALPTLIKKGPEIISKFANVINDNFPKILKKGVELIGQIVKGIIKAIPTLVKNIPKIITAIVDVWEAFNWLSLGKKAITWLKDGVLKMVGACKSAGKSIMQSITNVIKELPSKLLTYGKNAISKMASGIKSMAGNAKTAGRNVFNGIVNIIKNLPSKLLTYGKNAVSRLGSAIGNGLGTVKSKATGIFNAVVNNVKNLPTKLKSVGKDLVRGLWNGISDMTGWIVNKIEGFCSTALDSILSFFGISSPSKTMADRVGHWLPAGLAQGIEDNEKTAIKSMTNMAKSALGAANAELSGTTLNVPGSNGGSNGTGTGGQGGKTFVFNQYNTSPKALSRAEIYRNTKNALRFATSNA